jgi:hypothetical protein
LNLIEVITGNDYIINIKKKQNGVFGGATEEEGRIIKTDGKTQSRNCRAKLSKPSSRCPFQTIKGTTKSAHLVKWMRKTRWRLHIDFFTQVPIEEGIFDIHLK